jgi:hypothetical protein
MNAGTANRIELSGAYGQGNVSSGRDLLLGASLLLGAFFAVIAMVSAPDLLFAVVAFMTTVLLVYAGSKVKEKMRGELVTPVVESLYILCPTLCLLIVFAMRPSTLPAQMGDLALPLFATGTIISLSPLAKARRPPALLVLRSLVLMVVGFIFIPDFGAAGQQELGNAVTVGLIVSGLASLLALLRQHSNVTVRSVALMFESSRNMALATFLFVSLSVYALYLRGSLMTSAGGLYVALELIVTALAVLFFALRIKRRMDSLRREERGLDLHELVREPSLASTDLEKATHAVKEFVMNGRKEEAVVLIVSALKSNGLGEAEIAALIRELVQYHEEKVGLAWAWTYGSIVSKHREDRTRLLGRVLQQASVRLGKEKVGPVAVPA